MAVSVSLAFSKSWGFFCIPADCVSSVEVGPGSPLKPCVSPDDSGLILRRGLAWLLSCYIWKWWQSGAMEKDSSAQASWSRLKMTRPWKRSLARLCVIPAAWMPLMLEGRNPNQICPSQSKPCCYILNVNMFLWSSWEQKFIFLIDFQMPRPLR